MGGKIGGQPEIRPSVLVVRSSVMKQGVHLLLWGSQTGPQTGTDATLFGLCPAWLDASADPGSIRCEGTDLPAGKQKGGLTTLNMVDSQTILKTSSSNDYIDNSAA